MTLDRYPSVAERKLTHSAAVRIDALQNGRDRSNPFQRRQRRVPFRSITSTAHPVRLSAGSSPMSGDIDMDNLRVVLRSPVKVDIEPLAMD